MKSSKTLKLILVMVISVVMVLSARCVFAVDDLSALLGTSTPSNTTTTPANTTTTPANTTTTPANATTGNTVKSNTTNDLPKTGVGDSASTVLFVVVLGISAVFAYKKVQDYKNI